MTENVIDFVKALNEKNRTSISDMTADDIAAEVADDVVGYLMLKLTEDFADIELDEDYYKDIAVVLHAIQAAVLRMQGVEHPFHVISELFSVKETADDSVEIKLLTD